MPTPSDHFYNIKRLHVVFAVSSLAMLAVTVWMLAADHRREWKIYQRTFRDDVEPWLTEARILQERTAEFHAREQELTEALAKAREAVPERRLIERFQQTVREDCERGGVAAPDFARVGAAYDALHASPSARARDALLARLQDWSDAASLRRENAERRLRFRRADFDEARSGYEAAVGEGKPQAHVDRLREKASRLREELGLLAAEAEAASTHCEALAGILGEITRDEAAARRSLADHRAMADRLDRSLAQQRPSVAKQLLRLPLIDAFGRPLSVEQIWLPDLTIDYNFRQVARFDRCTSCHQGIDKTAPGTLSAPACRREATLTAELATSAKAPESAAGQLGDPESTLEKSFGLVLAPRGILDPQAATVQLVLPRSAAARADLHVGDVILKVNDVAVTSRSDAAERLAQPAEWGRALKLEIRRGLRHPYSSHPRLDLFVGALSPHPASTFGCTICHEGQGSATEFAWASHTPNDPADRQRWRREHGWFWNADWDFPMRPKRLAESGCLRCHPQVADLEASTRFPDPPAPKLLAGYHLVRQNGCFGCHEIKGTSDSGARMGPDMRLEPSSAEAASQLPAEESRASGTMRKVGPSLRNVAAKLDARFLDSFLRQPAGFRPDTRMPQFFGLHEHLSGQELENTRRLEAVEVYAVTEHLLSGRDTTPVGRISNPSPDVARISNPSLDVARISNPSTDAERISSPFTAETDSRDGLEIRPTKRADSGDGLEIRPTERGKRLFRTHGCLACHKHADFPEGRSTVAPDLSRLGGKLTSDAGKEWLVEWIRDPVRYSPRTAMPNALLEPVALAAPEENGDVAKPRITDPAADIAAYLAASAGWKASPRPALVAADLDEVALLYLSTTFPRSLAGQYLRDGIPESMAGQVQGDARELLGTIDQQKKLRYVARRTIRKRGCYGCHDLPGFEDAQPIGPALSDWGRKQVSLLAFEQINQFVGGQQAVGSGQQAAESPTNPSSLVPRPSSLILHPSSSEDESRQAFFTEALLAHRREGFLWQKLHAPRSFDYTKTENKGFHEHLLMGRFTLSDAEIEAIITFVLGLVAEPPAEKYVHQPQGRELAIVEGRKALDKYACAECHTLELERWTFRYDPASFPAPRETADYAFLKPRVAAEQLAASTQLDRCGLGRAEVVGMPRVDVKGKLVEEEDDEGKPLYVFDLREPVAINGKVWPVGGAQVPISPSQLVSARAPWGGALARLLYPAVLAEAKASGATASEVEAWGWVPPALAHEGLRVEPSWVHDYLLNPFPVRPAAVLRMPRYNLSSAEAGKLADFFAAVSDAESPYTTRTQRRETRQSVVPSADSERLAGAMRILTDRKTFCAKCHLIGDASPGGQNATILAPNLEGVGRRIRPEYLRRWLANPKSVLPYTAMPVNFPPTGEPLGQDLYRASSSEQLDAMVDLLLNYDWYITRRTSIQKMIESAEKK